MCVCVCMCVCLRGVNGKGGQVAKNYSVQDLHFPIELKESAIYLTRKHSDSCAMNTLPFMFIYYGYLLRIK